MSSLVLSLEISLVWSTELSLSELSSEGSLLPDTMLVPTSALVGGGSVGAFTGGLVTLTRGGFLAPCSTWWPRSSVSTWSVAGVQKIDICTKKYISDKLSSVGQFGLENKRNLSYCPIFGELVNMPMVV